MSEHNLSFENDGFKLTVSLTTTATHESWDDLLWPQIVQAVMGAISQPKTMLIDPDRSQPFEQARKTA